MKKRSIITSAKRQEVSRALRNRHLERRLQRQLYKLPQKILGQIHQVCYLNTQEKALLEENKSNRLLLRKRNRLKRRACRLLQSRWGQIHRACYLNIQGKTLSAEVKRTPVHPRSKKKRSQAPKRIQDLILSACLCGSLFLWFWLCLVCSSCSSKA